LAGTRRYNFTSINQASDDARDYDQTYPNAEVRGYKQTLDDCTICQVEQNRHLGIAGRLKSISRFSPETLLLLARIYACYVL
jgi:hypothetical protein